MPLSAIELLDLLSTKIMAGQIRPDEKLAKLAYKLLGTPKDQQQKDTPKPTDDQKKRWYVDSLMSQ